MILREYLYVDTDRVRGLQAQLDGGIAEEQRRTTSADKRTSGGAKGVFEHYAGSSEQEYVHKSLGDALFPTLEEALESQGLLRDLSSELQLHAFWESDQFRTTCPPGTIIRLTASGSLFDARYVARAFSNLTVAIEGVSSLSDTPAARSQSRGGGNRPRPAPAHTGGQELEDAIPNVGAIKVSGTQLGLTSDQLRGFIKIARALFNPGLHLNLFPTNDIELSVGVRMKEGRQFLESDAELLFAGYGMERQDWTAVGTIGYFAEPSGLQTPDFGSIVNDTGTISRTKTANTITEFLRVFGRTGLVDVVAYPGFTILPLAVYRSIPRVPTDTLEVMGHRPDADPKR